MQALVFVGDALEENPDKLSHDAGELGRLGVPAFMSRRATIEMSSRSSVGSLGRRMAPIAASIPAQHANWPSFYAPWRFMPPAG